MTLQVFLGFILCNKIRKKEIEIYLAWWYVQEIKEQANRMVWHKNLQRQNIQKKII